MVVVGMYHCYLNTYKILTVHLKVYGIISPNTNLRMNLYTCRYMNNSS